MSIKGSANTRSRGAVAILFATVLLGGCGEDTTGPALTGSAQAYVADEPSSGTATAGDPQAVSSGPSQSGHGSSSYSGTLDADAQVSISASGDVWIDLGPPSAMSLALQASNDGMDVHGQVEVPVGVYPRVRLVLTGAEARLNAGGTIGGITLSATTTLSVGADGTVLIEKQVPPFEVRADTHTSVHWDLNSHFWIHEENVQDEEVEEQEVDDASEARTVSEPRESDMQ
jgi:hypothetical protein